MALIDANYPHGFTDEKIKEHIAKYAEEIVDAGGHANAVAFITPLIQMGQLELQMRQTEQQGRQTKWATRLSIGVAIFALVISGWGLQVTDNAAKASSRWEESQLAVLDTVKAGLDSIVVAMGSEGQQTHQQLAATTAKASKRCWRYRRSSKRNWCGYSSG
jgi:hypothetical protein